MDALRLICQRKLHGYVLLESIVSMVIIMTCFGIAMLVFTTALSSSGSKLKVEARIRLQKEAEMCKSNSLYVDEDIPSTTFIIERRIKKFKESDHVAILELRAITPDGKVLAEHYELVQH